VSSLYCWSWTCYVTQINLKVMILLPQPQSAGITCAASAWYILDAFVNGTFNMHSTSCFLLAYRNMCGFQFSKLARFTLFTVISLVNDNFPIFFFKMSTFHLSSNSILHSFWIPPLTIECDVWYRFLIGSCTSAD
jgi:hypothetical protein